MIVETYKQEHVYVVDTKLMAYYLYQRGRSIFDFFEKLSLELVSLKKRGQIIAVFDIGKSQYRVSEQSYYKEHRANRLNSLGQKAIDDHKLFNQNYMEIYELCKLLPNVTTLGVKGVEADDLASIYISQVVADNPNVKVTLLTGDYDWFHMVVGHNNVRLYDYTGNTFYYKQDVYDKYGLYTRRQFSVLKSIIGDKSDNIKFVRNLGAVKGTRFFNENYDFDNETSDSELLPKLEEFIDSEPRMSVHELHVQDGRETIIAAYNSNMLIADPFTDFSKLNDTQSTELKILLSNNPKLHLSLQAWFDLTSVIIGYPLQLTNKTQKVLGIT